MTSGIFKRRLLSHPYILSVSVTWNEEGASNPFPSRDDDQSLQLLLPHPPNKPLPFPPQTKPLANDPEKLNLRIAFCDSLGRLYFSFHPFLRFALVADFGRLLGHFHLTPEGCLRVHVGSQIKRYDVSGITSALLEESHAFSKLPCGERAAAEKEERALGRDEELEMPRMWHFKEDGDPFAVFNALGPKLDFYRKRGRVRLLQRFSGAKQESHRLRSCEVGGLMICGSEDSLIYVWGGAETAEMTIEGHSAVVNSIFGSPSDKSVFASASDDGTVRLWRILM
ncbi:hypothetical protein MHBO_003440 [Bonamia ostreae]|uniref:Uncharacterized protein n=1 Tax=Bonamia ostreae TaxID=126728 RepID=A0ABV2AR15_9EUKA